MSNFIFGLDIGGTGIKGGIVDIDKGVLVTDRRKLLTPKPATPKEVVKVVGKLLRSFDWDGPIGCGFPSIVKNNVCKSATNISQSWIGVDIGQLIKKETGSEVRVINDADAAGLCEMRSGVIKDEDGHIILLTIGTGIGSAMFHNGELWHNSELGALFLNSGIMLEHYVSNVQRKKHDWSWMEFGEHFNVALNHIERLFSPDQYVLGGGACKKFAQFKDALTLKHKVKVAQHMNGAGTIGAAMLWADEKTPLVGELR